MASKRMLELKRIEPSMVPIVKIQVGQMFPVTARILADNIGLCEVVLTFDELVLEETTRNPNPRKLAGPDIDEQIGWQLRGKEAVSQTFVSLNATGNGIPQMSEFSVEVTQ